jgi:dynein intermediate chain
VDYVDHEAELYELPTKVSETSRCGQTCWLLQPPNVVVTYTKAVQTASTSTTFDDDLDPDDEIQRDGRDGGSGRETEHEMRIRIFEELEQERKTVEKEINEIKLKADQHKLEGENSLRNRFVVIFWLCIALPDEQRQVIFAAPDFSAFIEESTRIVQRALSDGYDYIKDYTIGLDGAL